MCWSKNLRLFAILIAVGGSKGGGVRRGGAPLLRGGFSAPGGGGDEGDEGDHGDQGSDEDDDGDEGGEGGRADDDD